MTKKITIALWVACAVCAITTIILWFPFNNSNPESEEVKVKVVSAKTEQVRNKKTGSTTNFYKVEVDYNGKVYNLENVHNTYSYPEGKTVTAYLSNNRLFADKESVKIGTPIATVYYVFLIGSFVFLFAACIYSSKHPKQKQ